MCFQVLITSNRQCSILVGDFNAKLSKLCPSDKYSKAGHDIDTFTTTSGYTQMIGQPTHIMNDKVTKRQMKKLKVSTTSY